MSTTPSLPVAGKWPGYPMRFREYVAQTNSQDHHRYAGCGMTLDHVIAEYQMLYRDLHERNEAAISRGDRAEEPRELAAGWNDVAIWEGWHVVAILRPDPAGEPALIVDFLDAPVLPPLRTRGTQ